MNAPSESLSWGNEVSRGALKSKVQVLIQALFSQKDVRNSVMEEFWHVGSITPNLCILFLIRFDPVCLILEFLLKPLI